MENLYAKIYCEQGVVRERKYSTEAEAQAYVDGVNAAKELTAVEGEDQLDYYHACADSEAARDEE